MDGAVPGAASEPGRGSATAEERKLLLQLGARFEVLAVCYRRGGEGPEKSLAEGPHSQIAQDPQRRWAEDL